MEIYYHRMWGQLSTTCSNVLKKPNEELLVAVNHNQLRTMASETVDPIDWSHPPPSWAVLPERHVYGINECNLSGTRTCNRSMRGNHPAYAATQGYICSISHLNHYIVSNFFQQTCSTHCPPHRLLRMQHIVC